MEREEDPSSVDTREGPLEVEPLAPNPEITLVECHSEVNRRAPASATSHVAVRPRSTNRQMQLLAGAALLRQQAALFQMQAQLAITRATEMEAAAQDEEMIGEEEGQGYSK